MRRPTSGMLSPRSPCGYPVPSHFSWCVYTHHEKWDGTGYPQGLRGESIPLVGRLMAVVDVYDAAVTTRRYHPALSHDDALKVIVEGRGTHFDPAIVDAFLAVSTA